jgi:hypothetical protein
MSAVDAAPPSSDGLLVARRNAELTTKHNEIWDLMGLSAAARDELNAIVLRVNAGMMANRSRNPEEYDKVFKDSKRKESITHEQYVADHLQRWQLLGIGDSTQRELLAAAEFCWTALHDPDATLTPKEAENAEIIRTMMKELGGPPPCCDENIFAKATAREGR